MQDHRIFGNSRSTSESKASSRVAPLAVKFGSRSGMSFHRRRIQAIRSLIADARSVGTVPYERCRGCRARNLSTQELEVIEAGPERVATDLLPACWCIHFPLPQAVTGIVRRGGPPGVDGQKHTDISRCFWTLQDFPKHDCFIAGVPAPRVWPMQRRAQFAARLDGGSEDCVGIRGGGGGGGGRPGDESRSGHISDGSNHLHVRRKLAVLTKLLLYPLSSGHRLAPGHSIRRHAGRH